MNQSNATTSIQVQDDDEILVAYLDDELSPDDRRSLEARLIDDAALRDRMRQLQTSWDLLTELPSPTPNTKMVQSTMELVVADLTGQTQRERSTSKKSRLALLSSPLKRQLIWFVAAALAMALLAMGFAHYRSVRQQRDFPIAMDLDAYRVAENLELMRALGADDLWQPVVAESRTESLYALIREIPSLSVTDWLQSVRSLPDDEASTASARWDRFASRARGSSRHRPASRR
ncbi:MAG: hypothetical protein AAF745_01760, partial [Planctomycetota bacterium]